MWKNMSHRLTATIYHNSCCKQHSLMQHVALKIKSLPGKQSTKEITIKFA